MVDDARMHLLATHRTWRWREDWDDPDHYLGLESTDEGFRFFAWSHLHGDDGLTRETRQSFDDFDRDGPAWPLPEDIERQVRAWLAGWLGRS